MDRVDIAALALLFIAMTRGGWLGAVRQIFSITALVAGLASAYFFGPIVGEQAAQIWTGGPGQTFLTLASGCLAGLITALSVGWLGRIIKGWLRAAGLGPADRTAGSLLGLAEGFLVIGLLVWLTVAIVGMEHEVLADTATLRWYEIIESWIGNN